MVPAVPSSSPLISLIIPVYNVKPYLRQCLDSVIIQSYRNLEIIVVDDGSTDGCGEICDDYASRDTRIKVFHKHNSGLSAARNFGLDHRNSFSRYIAFLDSDDWLEPDAINKLQNAAMEEQADIVSCFCYNEFPNGPQSSYSLEHREIIEGNQILEKLIKNENINSSAWNKLYKAELFNNVRYPAGMAFEDIATTHKLITLAHRVVIIPETLIHYRIRDNSLSRDYSMRSLIDYWGAYYERYLFLSDAISDTACKQILIGDCLLAINRMMRGYGGCKKEEQETGVATIKKMREFANEHRQFILKNKSYSIHQKMICVCAISWNPILICVLNVAYKTFRFLRKGLRYY